MTEVVSETDKQKQSDTRRQVYKYRERDRGRKTAREI